MCLVNFKPFLTSVQIFPAGERGSEAATTMILHIQRIKYHYFHCDRLRKISVSQHGEILQTIQARDSARAKELMRSHWLCSMENSLRDVAGMIHGAGAESGQDVLTK